MTHVRQLVRYDEATVFVSSVGDPRLRAALAYALTTVLVERGMDQCVIPAAPFDLRFYLEAVKAMFENDRVIREIIDGKGQDGGW